MVDFLVAIVFVITIIGCTVIVTLFGMVLKHLIHLIVKEYEKRKTRKILREENLDNED